MASVRDEIRIVAKYDGKQVDVGLKKLLGDMKRIEQDNRAVNGGFDGLNQRGGRFAGILGRIGPLMGAAFGAATVGAILNTSQELAKLAAQSEITEQVFGRLAKNAGSTGPAELEKLRAAVGGMLSDLELMQKVGAVVDAGLSFDQSRTALEFLRRYSLAFGKDFNQLTSTIFTGLQRGSTLMLDDAGIIIDASSDIYKGLSDVEKKSKLVGDAIEIMGKKMGTLPEIQDNTITQLGKLGAEWEKFKTNTGSLFEDGVKKTVEAQVSTLAVLNRFLEGAIKRQEADRKRQQENRQWIAQQWRELNRALGFSDESEAQRLLRIVPYFDFEEA